MFAAPRHTWQRLLTAGGIGLLLATVTHAGLVTNPGVLTDPTLTTGSNAIDPLGPPVNTNNSGDLDATGTVTGSATKAALTSLSDFAVVQSFSGFTGVAVPSGFTHLSQ